LFASAEPRNFFTELMYRSLVNSMTASIGRSNPYSRLAIMMSVACRMTSYVNGSPASVIAFGSTVS
jgi:hypothetical protein